MAIGAGTFLLTSAFYGDLGLNSGIRVMKPTVVVLSLLVLLAPVCARRIQAQAPAPGSWRDAIELMRQTPRPAGQGRAVAPRSSTRAEAKRALAGRLVSHRLPAAQLRSNGVIVAESEPNDGVATADSIALGDQATGVLDPAGDVDTWFVDLAAGQFVSLDVDAQSIGSALDPVLSLIAPDGQSVLSFNDDYDGLDSRISYRIPASGRYYLAIRGFGNQGGPNLRYAINVGALTCTAVGDEREPDDGPETATPFAIGGSVSGEICPHDDNPRGDVDYWAFTAQAGTAVELDVDAEALGVLADPFLAVFGTDGTTLLASNDDADGADSRLEIPIGTTGTYYAAISTLRDPGGNPFPYRVRSRLFPPGPGDPIRIRAQGIGTPVGLAVGSTGDLFVGDISGGRVVRVSTQGGGTTTVVGGITTPTGLAFDGSGQLLVVAFNEGVVYRVSPQGQATPFITDARIPFWVAVAQDGRIWVSDIGDRSLRRYSATGQFESRFDAIGIGGSGPGPIAISPSGDPYVSNGTEIWRLGSGGFQRVLTNQFIVWGFAFDVAGNIYAPSPIGGRMELFDAAGHLVSDPFAVGPSSPIVAAFARDQNGATLARLLATDNGIAAVIEMNPAGITLPGLPVGQRTASFAPEVAAASLLGGAGLDPGDLQLLDALGNHNGRYDLGDFQAFLRSVGGLPGTTGFAGQPR